jgi:hypothetical protein
MYSHVFAVRRAIEVKYNLQPGDIDTHRINRYVNKFDEPQPPKHRGVQRNAHEELILDAAANDIEVRQLNGIASRTTYIRAKLVRAFTNAGLAIKSDFYLLSKLRDRHPEVMCFKKSNRKDALRTKWSTAENVNIHFDGCVRVFACAFVRMHRRLCRSRCRRRRCLSRLACDDTSRTVVTNNTTTIMPV